MLLGNASCCRKPSLLHDNIRNILERFIRHSFVRKIFEQTITYVIRHSALTPHILVERILVGTVGRTILSKGLATARSR